MILNNRNLRQAMRIENISSSAERTHNNPVCWSSVGYYAVLVKIIRIHQAGVMNYPCWFLSQQQIQMKYERTRPMQATSGFREDWMQVAQSACRRTVTKPRVQLQETYFRCAVWLPRGKLYAWQRERKRKAHVYVRVSDKDGLWVSDSIPPVRRG